jgi:hypothetical protein
MSEPMKIKVSTKYLTAESFCQEVTLEEESKGVILSVMKFIVDTRDGQMRQALMGCGWTPPHEV